MGAHRFAVRFPGIYRYVANIDWILFVSALILVAAGLVTMNSFAGENLFFDRQLMWVGVSLSIFFLLSAGDYRFLRKTNVIVGLFLFSAITLFAILLFGEITKGAQSRFDLGIFAIQPADPIKLVVILLLAKYFSRRHVEIANIRHILVSGFYVFIIFALVFVQPDFGSAIIIFFTWLGMVLVSGISKKHLAIVGMCGVLAFSGLWLYAFEDYQKQRILTFLNPLTDLQGTGYNAWQSTIAVGSGEILGKGVGYGTQSKLQFLPEYETDFIFAAFAEEWGFVGVALLFLVFGVLFWRLIDNAIHGSTNFETLFAAGLAVLFLTHFIVHVGMNIGLLPVTGTTLPFLSYGGSHLVTEFIGLGVLMGMRHYRRTIHREDTQREFLGGV